MTKYTLYLGLNDRNTKKPTFTWGKAIRILSGMITDCTMIPVIGKYTHDDGVSVVIEKSIKIEVLDLNGDFPLENTVATLKRVFNQESIGVQWEETNGALM